MRVYRSFAFIDISGFTALTDVEGDERAVAVLSAFRSVLRDICSRRGVRIAKWLGDGAMLVCVDTTPLLAAALEVHYRSAERSGPTERICLRSGVAAGEVILLEGDDYIGHCVNVAARLCDLAEGQELLAAPTVLEALPRWADVRSTQEVRLRGLERDLRTARLGMRDLRGLTALDPVCGIPLSADVAESTAPDGLGAQIWFCSESCRDTWGARPRPPADELGSLRRPLIDS